MPLRLQADECTNGRVVAGVRRRGGDFVTAFDERLLGASDEKLLAHVIASGRVLVSVDYRILRPVHAIIEAGTGFPGLIFIRPGTSVGDAIRGIVLRATILEPEDMINWIEWVP